MRRVVNSRQVAHLFANQSQGDARNSSDSMSFDGDVGCSYSTAVARMLFDALGNPVMLLTARKYSVTTAKHIGIFAQAANGACFRVPSLGIASWGRHREENLGFGPDSQTPNHAANLAYLVREYETELGRLSRMRSRPYGTDWVREMARRIESYAEHFALDRDLTRNYDAEIAAALAKTIARIERSEARYNTPQAIAERERRAARKAELERIAREEMLARIAADVERWRNGEHVYLPYSAPTMLRVRDGRVQTSHGAEVTLRNARMLYHMIATHQNDAIVGHVIDGFTCRGIDASDTLSIGCHRIPMEEVRRFAQSQGW